MFYSRLKSSLLVGAFVAVFSGSAHALTFDFIAAGGTPQNVQDAFAAAGARWSNIFSDNITVRVNISFPSLGAGILGQASSSIFATTYANYSAALNGDKTSTDDQTALNSLPGGANFSTLINSTSTNAAMHTLTTANMAISNANAKAVGLLAGNAAGSDASIAFSSNFTWDFDPTDGITAGQFDLVGVATHEIGHALGFFSVVDQLDFFTTSRSDTFYGDRVNSLDLFRYASAGTRSISTGLDSSSTLRYFSIDGGTTNNGRFALGVSHGDGSQASHWRDNLGIGIMDPTAAPGELMAISGNDIRAFDVIGYTFAPVPEPGTMAVLGLGALAMLRRRKKS